MENEKKLKFKGNWDEIKSKIRQKYAWLTDEDLDYKEGKEEELLGRIQMKTGRNKEQIRKMIEKLSH